MTTSWVCIGSLFFQTSRVLSEGVFQRYWDFRHFHVKNDFFWKKTHANLGRNFKIISHYSMPKYRWRFSEGSTTKHDEIEKGYEIIECSRQSVAKIISHSNFQRYQTSECFIISTVFFLRSSPSNRSLQLIL